MFGARNRCPGLRGVRAGAGRVEGRSGVWLAASGVEPQRKIAAIGIRVARGTALHGFALNCDLRSESVLGDRAVRHRRRGVTSMTAELSRRRRCRRGTGPGCRCGDRRTRRSPARNIGPVTTPPDSDVAVWRLRQNRKLSPPGGPQRANPIERKPRGSNPGPDGSGTRR